MASLRRSRRPAPERRQLVLAAARLEFAARGLYGATGDRIAARAGITHPYLLRLFGSKKELFLAVVAAFFDQLQQALDPEGELSGREAALRLEQALERDAGRAFLLQAFAACSDPPVRQLVRRRLGALYEALEKELEPEQVRELLQRMVMSAATEVAGLPQLARRHRWARELLEL